MCKPSTVKRHDDSPCDLTGLKRRALPVTSCDDSNAQPSERCGGVCRLGQTKSVPENKHIKATKGVLTFDDYEIKVEWVSPREGR